MSLRSCVSYSTSRSQKVLGRPRFGHAPLRPLAAALALLACAAAAQAQTAKQLVSNTGQTDSTSRGFFNADHAQQFTTGSNAAGYMLTRVDLRMRRQGTVAPSYSVKIHENNSSDRPGAVVGTLTNPSSLSTSWHLAQFTSDGIALDPSTKYFVVFDISSGSISSTIGITESEDEDVGAETGWSIADGSLTRLRATTSWTVHAHPRKIAVRGYALSGLVSNTGLTSSTANLSFDHAQAFTTGSGTGGYKLTGVSLRLDDGTGTAPTYTVKIHENNSSNLPGTVKDTLTNPAWPSAAALAEFAAPAGGIDLAASTTYWLVLDVTADPSSTYRTFRTAFGSEDAGSKPGWSIADTLRSRSSTATAWGSPSATPLLLAIRGAPADNVAPAFDSATVNGTALTVTFDKDLDSGSVPASTAFTASGGRAGTGTATISGKTVSVTLDSAATHGETVTVGYSPPATGSKLQDAVGNLAAAFSGGAVTNNTPAPTDTTPPAFESATVSGSALAITFNELLDADEVPASSAFSASGGRSGTGTVFISAFRAFVTLDSAVKVGETVTVSYAQPTGASDPKLQDAAGNLVASFSAEPATNATPVPQTLEKLVGNTSIVTGVRTYVSSTDLAQAFTTGNNAAGYKLTFVNLVMKGGSGTAPTYTASVHADSSGAPGDSLGMLTNPDSWPAAIGRARHDAPAGGITLEAETKYWLVFDITANHSTSTDNWVRQTTTTDDDDADSAAGWSIADDLRWRNWGLTSWGTNTEADSLYLEIYGFALSTLVSNTGETPVSVQLFTDFAQQFTTGGGDGGYTLTGARLRMNSGSGTAPTYSVSVHANVSGPPEAPGALVGTLTNPASLPSSAGLVEFTAPSGGIPLDASTKYWLAFDITADPSTTHHVHETTGDSEDAGSKPGWSIKNTSLWKPATSTVWTNPTTNVRSVLLAIDGAPADNVAPKFALAEVNGTALTVTFSRDLDTGSAPAGSAFTVSGGGGRSGTGTATVSGKKATVTLDSAVAAGETVTVSYSPPTTGSVLRDDVGNLAAGFSGEEVTNNTVAVTVPVVSVASDGDIAAGSQASFTVTASVAPAADLTVSLNLTQTGGVLTPGSSSVVIQASQTSASVNTLATNAGSSGTVTLAVQTGTGYTVSPTAGSATVNVGAAGAASEKLVGTLDNASTSTAVVFGVDTAQAFTTGNNAAGYRLTRVDFRMQTAGSTTPTYSVKIHSNSASDAPGDPVATLTNPSSHPTTAALAQYSAPDGGIELAAETTYWLVRDVTGSGTNDWQWYVDASDDEDAGAAAGWSIANDSLWRLVGGSTWPNTEEKTQIFAVHGYALSKLVSNTGQTALAGSVGIGTSSSGTWRAATSFTTGNQPGGYALTAVDVGVVSTPTGSSPRVSIYTTDSSGLPASSLHVLNNPASFAANAVNTFTAAAGATLAANTTYAVVLENTAATGQYSVGHTNSDSEDSGGASGWSIANKRAVKQNDGDWRESSGESSLRIAIEGPEPAADTTAPAFQSATVNARSLSITFNESLDAGSRPSGGAFTVSGGRTGTGTAAISGATVSVTLNSAVAAGQSVTVSYLQPGGSKLQDASGNLVGSFTNRPVTNNTPGGTPPPPPPPQDPGDTDPPDTDPPDTDPQPVTRPGAPRQLTAVGGYGEVVLTWKAPPSDGGAAITDYEYRIDRRPPWTSTGSTDTTHTVSGLDSGTAYVFEVRAVNRVGSSSASNRAEATTKAPEVLNFTHFTNGDGIASDLVFVNVGTRPVRPALYFYDTEGSPIAAESVVDIVGDLEVAEDGALTVVTGMEPLGELTISTHGREALVTGSVKVVSKGPISGMLRYNLPHVGEAIVGAGAATSDTIFPVRRRQGGINTGVAIQNLESTEAVVDCELLRKGVLLDAVSITLAANGQTSWSIDQAFTEADTSDFTGSVRCDAVGRARFSAIALEADSDHRIFTTLPLMEVSQPYADPATWATTLNFAHFANGASILSELVFVNLETRPSGPGLFYWDPVIPSNRPVIYFYDPEGEPIAPETVVDIGGDLEVTEDGGLAVVTGMEPLGELRVSTHGREALVTGSVKVVSEGPVGGMLRYNLPHVGEAIVGAGAATSDAIFPVRRRQGGIDTGVAIHNLESTEAVVDCELLREGVLLDAVSITLAANGQTSWSIDQAFTAADTSEFSGSVRCTSVGDGQFSAIALEMDSDTRIFTTLPAMVVEQPMSQE